MPAAPQPNTGGFALTCPSCGYDRSGLERASLCPECGAEGLEGAFVLVGVSRISRGVRIVLVSLCGLFATMQLVSIVGRLGNPTMRQIGGALRPNYVDPPPSPGDFILLAACAIPCILLAWNLWGTAQAATSDAVVWTFHPEGVEVRTRRRRNFIPREDIARIECADFVLTEGSQFLLVPRRTSMRGVIGSTKALYLHGPKETRRDALRRVREQYPSR